jgi:hypothetical protein
MDVYSCRVRLKGSLLNTVNKEQVTAAEIVLLDHIHQGDNPAVYDIQKIGEAKRSDRQERDRLSRMYGEILGRPGAAVIGEVLGVGSVPLPQSIGDDYKDRLVDDNGIQAAIDEAKKPSREAGALVETDLLAEPAPKKAAEPEAKKQPEAPSARRTAAAG